MTNGRRPLSGQHTRARPTTGMASFGTGNEATTATPTCRTQSRRGCLGHPGRHPRKAPHAPAIETTPAWRGKRARGHNMGARSLRLAPY